MNQANWSIFEKSVNMNMDFRKRREDFGN